MLARLWMVKPWRCGDAISSAFLKRVEGAENISLEGGYHIHTEFLPMNDAAHRSTWSSKLNSTIIALEAKIGRQRIADQRLLRSRTERTRTPKGAHLIYLGPRLLGKLFAHTWRLGCSCGFAAREVAQSLTETQGDCCAILPITSRRSGVDPWMINNEPAPASCGILMS